MPRKVRLRYLKISAVHDSKGGLILFVLNRDLTYEMQLDVDARSFAGLALDATATLHDAAPYAINTKESPSQVLPRPLASVSVNGAHMTVVLPPASWSVIRLKAT